jgi:hypothetical protein
MKHIEDFIDVPLVGEAIDFLFDAGLVLWVLRIEDAVQELVGIRDQREPSLGEGERVEVEDGRDDFRFAGLPITSNWSQPKASWSDSWPGSRFQTEPSWRQTIEAAASSSFEAFLGRPG